MFIPLAQIPRYLSALNAESKKQRWETLSNQSRGWSGGSVLSFNNVVTGRYSGAAINQTEAMVGKVTSCFFLYPSYALGPGIHKTARRHSVSKDIPKEKNNGFPYSSAKPHLVTCVKRFLSDELIFLRGSEMCCRWTATVVQARIVTGSRHRLWLHSRPS